MSFTTLGLSSTLLKVLSGKNYTKPYPIQQAAIPAILNGKDVLGIAATGSGKTWIALKAMEKLLSGSGRAWYASPLKALSNSKYIEFGQHFGKRRVGILTGDRKENPRAPIIVGTTEILRNQLYDSMYQGDDLGVDLVVLDEAHYLGDEDRGKRLSDELTDLDTCALSNGFTKISDNAVRVS